DRGGVDGDCAVAGEEWVKVQEPAADLLKIAGLVVAVPGQDGAADVLVAQPLRARDGHLAAGFIMLGDCELLLGALEVGLPGREAPILIVAIDAAGVHLDPVDRAAVPVLELWLIQVAHVLVLLENSVLPLALLEFKQTFSVTSAAW